jgi:hypothetical protein
MVISVEKLIDLKNRVGHEGVSVAPDRAIAIAIATATATAIASMGNSVGGPSALTRAIVARSGFAGYHQFGYLRRGPLRCDGRMHIRLDQ